MNEEMRMEAMELCVTACEKHPTSNEVRLGFATVTIVVTITHAYI